MYIYFLVDFCISIVRSL